MPDYFVAERNADENCAQQKRVPFDAHNGGFLVAAADQRKFVDELRCEWKRLWKERYDDKEKAEGVAVDVYPKLFVDQGTVVHATRDFKTLNFKEILEKHEVDPRNIQPHPEVGGWHKFAKTQIAANKQPRKRRENYEAPKKDTRQQPKKGGRGWLHST